MNIQGIKLSTWSCAYLVQNDYYPLSAGPESNCLHVGSHKPGSHAPLFISDVFNCRLETPRCAGHSWFRTPECVKVAHHDGYNFLHLPRYITRAWPCASFVSVNRLRSRVEAWNGCFGGSPSATDYSVLWRDRSAQLWWTPPYETSCIPLTQTNLTCLSTGGLFCVPESSHNTGSIGIDLCSVSTPDAS